MNEALDRCSLRTALVVLRSWMNRFNESVNERIVLVSSVHPLIVLFLLSARLLKQERVYSLQSDSQQGKKKHKKGRKNYV